MQDWEVQTIMSRIRGKTDSILRQQADADAGKFTTIGAAIGLQKLRTERKVLQAQLPSLRLVQ